MALQETELTLPQQKVLDLMWETSTVAKVGRRFSNEDGTFRFEHISRPTHPIDFAQDGEFVLKLHEKRPEAPLSPYYINLRNLPDRLLTLVAGSIAASTNPLLEEGSLDFCAGIPSAGDPIAEKYLTCTGIPLRQVFGKAESSSGRKIVPALEALGKHNELWKDKWNRLLLIDDLVTEAGTKLEAISVAEELGYRVAGIAVLVDRQQGGKEQLEAKGYRVFAPLPISKVFQYYYTEGRINQRLYQNSMDYLNTARKSTGLEELGLMAG